MGSSHMDPVIKSSVKICTLSPALVSGLLYKASKVYAFKKLSSVI